MREITKGKFYVFFFGLSWIFIQLSENDNHNKFIQSAFQLLSSSFLSLSLTRPACLVVFVFLPTDFEPAEPQEIKQNKREIGKKLF